MLKAYDSLQAMLVDKIPEYKHNTTRHSFFSFKWDDSIVDFLEDVSARRCATRRGNYIIPGELQRARDAAKKGSAGCSIRFGNVKEGHGFDGERKDFCLVGGTYKAKTLTMFYRRLDLLGGLFYDMVIVDEVERIIGPIRAVVIYAVQSDVYARHGGSNEALYKKLRKHYGLK